MQLSFCVGIPCLFNLIPDSIDVRLAEIVLLVVALLVDQFNTIVVLVEDAADGSTALSIISETEVAPDGQVLVVPGIARVADADGELAILHNAVCSLLVAFAVEGKAGGIDIVGNEVAIALFCVDIDTACLFSVVRSCLIFGSIVTAVDTVLGISVAKFVGIDAQHGCSIVANEELSRDDIGAIEETFVTLTRTVEGLCRKSIDAISQASNLLADLELHVVGSSDGEDIGEASVMYHVVATLGATFSNSPTIPCSSVIELRINDERCEVGTFGSTVQYSCLQQLLGEGNLCSELLGIQQTIAHNI